MFAGENNAPMGYNYDDMWYNNVGGDYVSSVRIPIGYTVEFYEHANFRGLKRTF